MEGRTLNFADYRYGFNGKEADTNREWGSLTHYDYGFRIYNPAIARFLSVDPLAPDYPSWSPYPFAMNRPIDGVDLDGLEYAPAGKNESGNEMFTDEWNKSGEMVKLSGDNYLYRRLEDGNYKYWHSYDGGAWERFEELETTPLFFNKEYSTADNNILSYDFRRTGASSFTALYNGYQRLSYYKPTTGNLASLFNMGQISAGEYSIGRYLAQAETKSRLFTVGAYASESWPFGKPLLLQQRKAYGIMFLGEPLSANAFKTRGLTTGLARRSMFLGGIGLGIAGYQSINHVTTADDTSLAVAQELGGWTGAFVAGEVSAKIGEDYTKLCYIKKINMSDSPRFPHFNAPSSKMRSFFLLRQGC